MTSKQKSPTAPLNAGELKEIKRYTPEVEEYNFTKVALMGEDETGDWVKYEDYLASNQSPLKVSETSESEIKNAYDQFEAYFVKNYPGPTTIISDPKWHAPKIFRRVLYALEYAKRLTLTASAESPTKVSDERDGLQNEIEFLRDRISEMKSDGRPVDAAFVAGILERKEAKLASMESPHIIPTPSEWECIESTETRLKSMGVSPSNEVGRMYIKGAVYGHRWTMREVRERASAPLTLTTGELSTTTLKSYSEMESELNQTIRQRDDRIAELEAKLAKHEREGLAVYGNKVILLNKRIAELERLTSGMNDIQKQNILDAFPVDEALNATAVDVVRLTDFENLKLLSDSMAKAIEGLEHTSTCKCNAYDCPDCHYSGVAWTAVWTALDEYKKKFSAETLATAEKDGEG